MREYISSVPFSGGVKIGLRELWGWVFKHRREKIENESKEIKTGLTICVYPFALVSFTHSLLSQHWHHISRHFPPFSALSGRSGLVSLFRSSSWRRPSHWSNVDPMKLFCNCDKEGGTLKNGRRDCTIPSSRCTGMSSRIIFPTSPLFLHSAYAIYLLLNTFTNLQEDIRSRLSRVFSALSLSNPGWFPSLPPPKVRDKENGSFRFEV